MSSGESLLCSDSLLIWLLSSLFAHTRMHVDVYANNSRAHSTHSRAGHSVLSLSLSPPFDTVRSIMQIEVQCYQVSQPTESLSMMMLLFRGRDEKFSSSHHKIWCHRPAKTISHRPLLLFCTASSLLPYHTGRAHHAWLLVVVSLSYLLLRFIITIAEEVEGILFTAASFLYRRHSHYHYSLHCCCACNMGA